MSCLQYGGRCRSGRGTARRFEDVHELAGAMIGGVLGERTFLRRHGDTADGGIIEIERRYGVVRGPRD